MGTQFTDTCNSLVLYIIMVVNHGTHTGRIMILLLLTKQNTGIRHKPQSDDSFITEYICFCNIMCT